MATDLGNQSTSAASNTSVGAISIAEGCPMSNLNDGMRAIVAQAKGALLAVTAGGTANAITATYAPALDAYVSGWVYPFKAAATNTGATTFNANGLGAKNVFRQTGASLVACTGGEIISGQINWLYYDGTQMQIANLLPGSYLISSASAAGSATVDFTSGIDSTFDQYEIKFDNVVPATNATNLHLRISQSAAFKSGATNYAHVRNALSDAGTNTAAGTTAGVGAAQIIMAAGLSNTAGRGAQGTLRFSRPSQASEFKMFRWEMSFFDGTNSFLTTGQGFYTVDGNAIDGVRFLASAGNLTTGNFYLYGIRK